MYRLGTGKNMKIYINGKFLTQRITGVQRYALEMTKAIDELIGNNKELQKKEFILIVPRNIIYMPKLKNILILKKGMMCGQIWEQLELPIYTRDGFLLSFANGAPLVKLTQAVTIHDASICAMPNSYTFKFRSYFKGIFAILGKVSKTIYTVSEFSKKELNRYFNINLDKIIVTYNGVDHIKTIQADERIIVRKDLVGRQYILVVGSMNPSKNFSLVLQVAKQMPNVNFVIAGGSNAKVFNNNEFIAPPTNVNFIGYVTDEELMALYKNASVFIYPSIYEGFGIPPLEAMMWNCPVVVSDIEVFHEVYEDAAEYCPYDDSSAWVKMLRNILDGKYIKNRRVLEACLERYTWQKSANEVCKSFY